MRVIKRFHFVSWLIDGTLLVSNAFLSSLHILLGDFLLAVCQSAVPFNPFFFSFFLFLFLKFYFLNIITI